MKHLISASLLVLLLAASSSKKQTDPKTIAYQNNQFALELYGEIIEKEDGNIFISPFSISTALAMTYAGADGQTATEMAKAMHFGPNEPEYHYAYGDYLKRLEKNADGNIELKIANRLWGEKSYPINPDFVRLNKKAYNSPLQGVDFINHPEESRQTINNWVADKTEQRIKDLLYPGTISSDTRLVLTNAIYFKGDWLYQFKKNKTKPKKFHLVDGSTMKTPFMHFEGAFNFYHDADYKMIKLPYKGYKHSMVVVLPNEGTPLATIEKKMNPNMFDMLGYGYKPDVELALPKFKLTQPLNLNSYLQNLGIKTAFTNAADFSKMADGQALMISDVVHKAFVEINEEGTEAAAATAVVTVITSTVQQEIKPETFIADRPFLFYIIDEETKAILFMGRIMKPVTQ